MTAFLQIDYDRESHTGLLATSPENSGDPWLLQLIRVLADVTPELRTLNDGLVSVPWWAFLAIRREIGALLKSNNVEYKFTEIARTLLTRSLEREKSLNASPSTVELSDAEIVQTLKTRGWAWQTRALNRNQMRNVRKLTKFTSAATFSVPGAGKTTEALAFFHLKANPNQKLLIVAPKNAFISWDEQLALCVSDASERIVRLRGGLENIRDLIKQNNRYFILTYQQLIRVIDVVGQFLVENDSFVFLDESHRIKSGRGSSTADALLRIAHLPVGKLIMSGTPMPQSSHDLVSQFEFLYPEKRVTDDQVIEAIQPIFVRTTKAELDLPSVNRKSIEVPLNPAQERLYSLMKSEVVRQAEAVLTASARNNLRRLGRSVMRMLQVVSNPNLLLNNLQFLESDLLSEVLAEGSSPKLLFACERARQLAKAGKKSIIWTTFRQNVEIVSNRLADVGAVFIHGGIDAGESDDMQTREGRIKRFKEDPNCYVMVANPAAASEGISLHQVCGHAIYIDRTYNAAHYLQSEDRIHRLGLAKDASPTVEILICPGTIDESVQERLTQKVSRMATALNDNSLSIETIPYDIGDEPEKDLEIMDSDDIKSLISWLRNFH